ncbi:expressed unknown protein [Seminavis robusta]|uniref:Uncharacterized protein n=1 Tax=Seminavis robusta TaxID=568900 RepID=A0A9N8EC96_9STRA|nr:expressed unknown protein [Seminavis robusta]|eukprot:Sro962_g225110.1 n/a (682) ;mRNA; f:14351-16396
MEENEGFVKAIDSLSIDDSLFAVPLDHQYTTKSLARLGVRAFKGSDRAFACGIAAAKGWKMVVAQMTRTDFEMGSGSYYDGFDDDIEFGAPTFENLYHANGADAQAHRSWIDNQLDLTSVNDGGMVLASDDYVDEMWVEGESGEVSYSGNEGATRSTTYSACLLVAFADAGVTERVWRSNLSVGIKGVEMKPSLLPRFLSFLKRTRPGLSYKDFAKLYSVLAQNSSDIADDSYWKDFATLADCVTRTEPPTAAAVDLFAALVREHGWNDKTEPIRLILERLPDLPKAQEASGFFEAVHALLSIEQISGDTPETLQCLLPKLLDTLEKGLANTASNRYNSIYPWHQKQDWAPSNIVGKLVELATRHGWDRADPIAKGCFKKIRQNFGRSSDQLSEEMVAFERIRSSFPEAKLDDIRSRILEDFVDLAISRQSATVWRNPKTTTLVQELFRFGSNALFQRLQGWASKASLDLLTDAGQLLKKTNAKGLTCGSIQAKDVLVKMVLDRWKLLKLAHLKTQQAQLQKTLYLQGRPIFSWRMPRAKTPNAALNAFLHSDKAGPTRVVVGGGIHNARRLASNYFCYSASLGPSSFLRDGYSASIKSTQDTGPRASVIVTKTTDWYNDQLAKYEANVKALGEVKAKIRKYGGGVQAPASKRATVQTHGGDVPAPASKRARKEPDVIVLV